MIAFDHIAKVKPVNETSLTQDCIDIMFDNLCFELPVERNGKMYGTVQLDECVHSQDDTIEYIVEPGFASVHYNTHLFDVLHVFNESNANVISVMDNNFEHMGILTKTNVMEAVSASLTAGQPGAVIVLEMASSHYSVAEISRLIESEGSQILGLWLHNLPKGGRIRASIELNTKNAERIVNSLHRFKYDVVATFGDDDYKENVEKRFQSLMNYLDL